MEAVDWVGLSEANGASAWPYANLSESWDLAVEDIESESRWVRGSMLTGIGSEVSGGMLASISSFDCMPPAGGDVVDE